MELRTSVWKLALVLAVMPTLAHAEPKPLNAVNQLDEIEIEYRFPPGVKWCFDRYQLVLSGQASTTMIDINKRDSTVSFESTVVDRKVICEPSGVRTIFDGVEKFISF